MVFHHVKRVFCNFYKCSFFFFLLKVQFEKRIATLILDNYFDDNFITLSIVMNCFYKPLIYFLLHNLSTPIVLFLRLVFDQIVRQLENENERQTEV